jgi:hypothetical protein
MSEDRDSEITDIVQQLAHAGASEKSRSRLLHRLTRAIIGSARKAGAASVTSGRWLVDLLLQVAPRIPVRDLATLWEYHHGLSGDALADSLINSAVRGTTTVGAAGGGLAAVEFTAPPTLLSAPLQIAAETLVIAAIEVKLIAELHEVYGVVVPGNGRQRALAFVQAWTSKRGVDPMQPGSLTFALGSAAREQLRRRLLRRAGRNVTTLAPFLAGAASGAVLNHQATRQLAAAVRADLRRRTAP